MSKKSLGFTLIELVMVITIVAILAAVALPRFVALQQQARTAKVQAFSGTIRAAAVIAKAACLADLGTGNPGTCTSSGGTISIEGNVVNMQNQYPIASTGPSGIVGAIEFNPANDGVTVSLNGSSPPFTATNFDINGGTVPNCRVTYQPPAAVGAAVLVTITTSGC